MKRMGFVSIILLAGVSLSAACAESEVDVSFECGDSMRLAGHETDVEAANPLIVATLSSCSTADEWLAALREYPRALGLTERAEIGAVDLEAACYFSDEAAAAPVCVDAVDRGLISAP